LCQFYHDRSHKYVNFYERFYLCSDHYLPFVSYCIQCNINLCEKCKEDHSKHKKIINKKDVIPPDAELEKIKSNAKEVKKYCEELKAEIKRTQMIFNKVVNYFLKNLEGYSILNNNILEWVKDLKNYETIKNIINLNEYNKIYKKTLSEILSLSINDKVRYLMKFYDEKRKELTIYYKNPKKDNFILFNNSFVDNNKNNCYIKIRNEKHELKERYSYSKNNINNEKDLPILKVKLIREKKLNLYKMFQGCLNLLSFDEDEFFFIWDVDKIIYFFSGCENLQNLPDLSVMNALNIADFSSIFHKCSALTSLPDISKWKTSNAKSMKTMFKECKNLSILFI
jgi:surface protein